MFQKGTGERFKYKEAVIEKYPEAICKRTPLSIYPFRTRQLYQIFLNSKEMSSKFNRAEDAWSDAWLKIIR